MASINLKYNDQKNDHSGDWIFNFGTPVLEAYKKQLTLASEFYSNVFNQVVPDQEPVYITPKNQVDLFFNNNEALRSLVDPYNEFKAIGTSLTIPVNPFDKMIKQITEYNQNLMDVIFDQFKDEDLNWNKLNNKYKTEVSKKLESSKKLISTLISIYSEEMETAYYSNILKEINFQIEIVFNTNQQFWCDVVDLIRSTKEQNKMLQYP